VGISQSVLIAPAVPVVAKRAVVLMLAGEKEEFIPGQPIHFTLRVLGPSDAEITSHQVTAPMPQSLNPRDLPGAANIASETIFSVKEYGRHAVIITVQIADHPELSYELDFYVVKPSDGRAEY
jgi:hypothetical protein